MSSISMHNIRTRKFKSEINVVPYIDVMLVLLVIFMVTAPITNPNAINLPTTGHASQPPTQYIQISLKGDDTASIGIHNPKGKDSGQEKLSSHTALLRKLTDLHQKNPDYPLLIAADKNIRYEVVVKTIADAKKIGVERVALATN